MEHKLIEKEVRLLETLIRLEDIPYRYDRKPDITVLDVIEDGDIPEDKMRLIYDNSINAMAAMDYFRSLFEKQIEDRAAQEPPIWHRNRINVIKNELNKYFKQGFVLREVTREIRIEETNHYEGGDCENMSAWITIKAHFSRMETDEELKKRIDKELKKEENERQIRQTAKQKKEEKERKLYERLKVKFEEKIEDKKE